jgi:hypothetical protein
MPEPIDHYHCPLGCEHPQPFVLRRPRSGGKSQHRVVLLCGRCWFVDGVATVVVPCTPEICGED